MSSEPERSENINRLVEIVANGQVLCPDDFSAAQEVFDDMFFDGWVIEGVGIPKSLIVSYQEEAQVADYFGIEAVEDITNADRVEYIRETMVNFANEPDADLCPGFKVAKTESTSGKNILVVQTVRGYSFSGVETEFFGLFRTLDDFRDEVRRQKIWFTEEIASVEDTELEISDDEILQGVWS